MNDRSPLARTVVSVGSYPILLAAGIGAVAFVLEYFPGGRVYETLLVSVALGSVIAILLLLQHVLPARPDWQQWREDWPTDVAHSVISATIGTASARILLFAAVGLIAANSGRATLGWWPSDQPLLVQLPLAILISDLGMYWLHRASHTLPALWRIHAVHHSSLRLYTLSSGRVHPLYVGLSVICATGPILLLGAPPPLFALLSTAVGINGLLQHSNLDLDCRPYRWLLATADIHRWHHSADPEDGRYNFGNTLSLWDRLFGTWRSPEGLPAQIGLAGPYPSRFFGQLAEPLRRS